MEADIRSFFDAIDHDWLIRMLELCIADKASLRLIKKWLKAGVLDTDGMVKHPVTGEAVQFYQIVGERLEKFGLELAPEKTNIISFSRFRKEEKTKLEFLGFEFRWGVSLKGNNIIKRRTASSKLRKSLAVFTQWCREVRMKRLRTWFIEFN